MNAVPKGNSATLDNRVVMERQDIQAERARVVITDFSAHQDQKVSIGSDDAVRCHENKTCE